MGIWVGKAREDGTRMMQVWGKVTRDPKIGQTRRGDPKVTFSVCYEKGEFMNILAAGDDDTTRIACSIEHGDIVDIKGIWSAREYTTRDGEKKVWSECRADVINVQSLMAAVLDLLRGNASDPAPEPDTQAPETGGVPTEPCDDDDPLPWDDYQPTV